MPSDIAGRMEVSVAISWPWLAAGSLNREDALASTCPPVACHSGTSIISSLKAALWNWAGTAFWTLPLEYVWRRLRDYVRGCSTDDTKRLNAKGFGCREGLHIDMVYVIVALGARIAKSASPEVLATRGWIRTTPIS